MRSLWVLVLAWFAVASPAVAPQPGRGSAARVDIAATAARIDALHVRIHGNRAQRQASELINYHRVEGGVAACMRAAGREYRIRPFVSRYDEITDADLGFGSGSGSVVDSIADRGRRSILNELAGARLARAGVSDSWGSVRPADSATLNRCTAPFQHRLYPDFDPPAGTDRFSGFGELTGPAERDPAVIAAMRPYRTCMRTRHGYDVDERTDFLFTPRLSYRDAPTGGRPPSYAWNLGVARIRQAFDADIDCRLPAYRLAMAKIGPRIDAWERAHRAEIDAIQAEWNRRVAEARTLPRTIEHP